MTNAEKVKDFDRSSVLTFLARWSFDGGQSRPQSGGVVGTTRRLKVETIADLLDTGKEELERKTDRPGDLRLDYDRRNEDDS